MCRLEQANDFASIFWRFHQTTRILILWHEYRHKSIGGSRDAISVSIVAGRLRFQQTLIVLLMASYACISTENLC